MSSPPLVSILLLSMNHESYIEQCIESLSQQTYPHMEIIFLDNASTDQTFEKGKRLLERSGIPSRSFSNKEPRSISQNINYLLDRSAGSYISPLSADDWFEKDNIERKITLVQGKEDVGAVYSNGWIYDESTKKAVLNDSTTFRRGNIFREILIKPDCIFYVGILYKRDVLEKAGKWDENLIIEDVDMLIRISQMAKIDFIDAPLVYYRRTIASASKNKAFMLKGFRQYYDKYRNVEWINMKKWLGERYRTIATTCIDQKNGREAFAFLKEALKLNPFSLKNYRSFLYLIKSRFIPKSQTFKTGK